MMINVILCGGSGTRLWPVSRTEFPKQFHKFFDGLSLFQQTLRRNASICEKRMIVTNMSSSVLCHAQEQETGVTSLSTYLIEPAGRNTAPAIALAALTAAPDDVLLVCPSDHAIADTVAYHRAIARATELAEQGHIVTFGIKPDRPETGYGYIKADGENVISFKEKPDLVTAKSYMADGFHYWNSGIFCFKASTYLAELEKYAQDIHETSQTALTNAARQDAAILIAKDDMLAIPSNSIDYAVMEHSALVKVVPCACGWSDLGSFDSLYDYLDKDEAGNVTDPQAVHVDSTNNYTHSVAGRPIVTVDVHNLVIVDTPDALLVSSRGKTHNIPRALDVLKQTPEYAELCQKSRAQIS